MGLNDDYAYYKRQAAADRKSARVLRSTGSNRINDDMIEMLEKRAAQWEALAVEIAVYQSGTLV